MHVTLGYFFCQETSQDTSLIVPDAHNVSLVFEHLNTNILLTLQNKMASPDHGGLSADSVVLHNLRASMYKQLVLPLDERVVSMTTHASYAFVGTSQFGCHVFR